MLQSLIEKIVGERPRITARQLEEKLRSYQGLGIIADIDEEVISFANKDDRLKDAKVSGLKDRLSRAKAKVKSRYDACR
jgi:hypothetical protein